MNHFISCNKFSLVHLLLTKNLKGDNSPFTLISKPQMMNSILNKVMNN